MLPQRLLISLAQGTIADGTKLNTITNVPLDESGNLSVKKVACVKFVYNKAETPKGVTADLNGDKVPVLEVKAVQKVQLMQLARVSNRLLKRSPNLARSDLAVAV